MGKARLGPARWHFQASLSTTPAQACDSARTCDSARKPDCQKERKPESHRGREPASQSQLEAAKAGWSQPGPGGYASSCLGPELKGLLPKDHAHRLPGLSQQLQFAKWQMSISMKLALGAIWPAFVWRAWGSSAGQVGCKDSLPNDRNMHGSTPTAARNGPWAGRPIFILDIISGGCVCSRLARIPNEIWVRKLP